MNSKFKAPYGSFLLAVAILAIAPVSTAWASTVSLTGVAAGGSAVFTFSVDFFAADSLAVDGAGNSASLRFLGGDITDAVSLGTRTSNGCANMIFYASGSCTFAWSYSISGTEDGPPYDFGFWAIDSVVKYHETKGGTSFPGSIVGTAY